MTTNKLTLGYWDVRGNAQPARTLLEYLQIPYDQDLYKNQEAWQTKKERFGHLFANLPYLIDGGKAITESDAIIAYICLKAGKPEMAGKSEDFIDFLQIKGIVADIRIGLSMAVYGAKEKEDIPKIIEARITGNGGTKLKDLNEILGEKEWLMGSLTYLDFCFAELLERFQDMDAELGMTVLEPYPNLQAYLKRFVELPGVKEYRASERFKARPYNNPAAKWF